MPFEHVLPPLLDRLQRMQPHQGASQLFLLDAEALVVDVIEVKLLELADEVSTFGEEQIRLQIIRLLA